ncbi:hypothetical protein GC177_04100 [bacterium]|nr:hypothetical protein [bacterium]
MLNFMRDASQSFVVKLLLIVLIGSFAFWGIGDVFKGGMGSVASVGKARMSQGEFQMALNDEMRRFQQMFPGQKTPDNLQPMMAQNIIGRFVQQNLISQEAERLGIAVTDQQVVENIQKDEAFQENGKYSPQKYVAALNNVNLSEAKYLSMLKQEMLSRMFIGNMTGTPIPLPQHGMYYQQFLNTKHELAVITIPHGVASTVADPTAEQLKAFYDKNKEGFATGEYRAFDVSFITHDAVKSAPDVDEKAIAHYYDEHKDLFQDDNGKLEPLDAVRGRIREELGDLKNDDTLRAIANKFDDGFGGGAKLAEQAKKLGFKLDHVAAVNADGKTPEGKDADVPAKLKPVLGKVMSVDPSQGGFIVALDDGSYAAIEVTNKVASKIPPMDEIKDKLVTAWKTSRAAEVAQEKAAKIAKEWASENGIGNIAAKYDLTTPQVIAITRKEPDKSVPQSVQGQAVELKTGGVTQPQPTPKGDWVVAKLLKQTVPQNIPQGEIQNAGNQMLPTLYQDVLAYYEKSLRQHHNVTINLPEMAKPQQDEAGQDS